MSVKRIFIYVLWSVFLTLLFTFLLYNAVQFDKAILYFISFCAFFVATAVIGRKQQISWPIVIIILLPTIVIDASVFITFPALVPLRFPFATLFPVLGVCGGFLYLYRSKIYSLGLTLAVIAFSVLSWKYFIPGLEYYGWRHNSYTLKNKTSFLKGNSFLNEKGDTIDISSSVKTACILYENYYVGCSACEAKYVALKQLNDSLDSTRLQIKMICSNVSSFESFAAHAQKNKYPGITFLFDYDNSMKPDGLPIELFPLELLTYKGDIIATYEGFGYSYVKAYTDDHIKLINSIEQ